MWWEPNLSASTASKQEERCLMHSLLGTPEKWNLGTWRCSPKQATCDASHDALPPYRLVLVDVGCCTNLKSPSGELSWATFDVIERSSASYQGGWPLETWWPSLSCFTPHRTCYSIVALFAWLAVFLVCHVLRVLQMLKPLLSRDTPSVKKAYAQFCKAERKRGYRTS